MRAAGSRTCRRRVRALARLRAGRARRRRASSTSIGLRARARGPVEHFADASPPTRTSSAGPLSRCATATGGLPVRGQLGRVRRDGGSPASRAPPGTSPSGSASSASCASPRSATGSSSRTRRTSSSRPTPRASSRSSPRRSRRMTGYRPGRARRQALLGDRHRRRRSAIAVDRWAKLVADPAIRQVREARSSSGKDGGTCRSRSARSGRADGVFAGIHGATRDITRARAARARAAQLRGALPLLVSSSPDRRLGDRRRGRARVRERRRGGHARVPAADLLGRPYCGGLRADDAGARPRSGSVAEPPSDVGPPVAPAVPPRRRPRRPGRDQRHRRWSTNGRFVGAARGRPRRQRARPPRTDLRRQAGELARRPGAGPPRPRAPRLGDPGAVQHDPRSRAARSCSSTATRRPRRSSSARCATSSARRSPRCGR